MPRSTQRVGSNLDVPPGTQKIADIEAELAGAQTTLAAATDRQQQTADTLSDMLRAGRRRADGEVGAEDPGAANAPAGDAADDGAAVSRPACVNYI